MSDRPTVDKMLQQDRAEVKIGCRIAGYYYTYLLVLSGAGAGASVVYGVVVF